MDEWKLVSDKGSEFLVARDGRVKVPARNAGGQMKAEKLLSPFLNHRGYAVVAQKRGPRRPKHFVHRLVGIAFVPGHFDGATINHKNGDKTNNSAENLEWITKEANTAHQWRTGLVNLRGERHPLVKLSDANLHEVRRRLADGHRVAQIAADFAVSDALIYKIRRGTKRVA